MLLDCRSTVSLLDDDHGGKLSHFKKAALVSHLAFCVDCSRYRHQLATLRSALRSLAMPGVSTETKAKLAERFRTWKATMPKGDP